jgi:hypothetical protein
MAKRVKKAKPQSIIGYMCGVDYEFELGEASDGNKVYPDVASLKAHRKCVDEDGIVQVEVRFKGWAQTPREDGECGKK